MSTNAVVVSVLKKKAEDAASKADATPQATAAKNVADEKITTAAAIIQKSFDIINASASAVPGNAEVTKAVADIADIKKKSDEIVAAVKTDVEAARATADTKP